MNKRALGALLLGSVLVAAFYSLQDASDWPEVDTQVVPMTSDPPRDGAGVTGVAAPRREEAPSSTGSEPPGERANPEESIAERPNLPTEASDVGALRLTGTVSDVSGLPVAGVMVRIERFSSDEQASDETLMALWDSKVEIPIEDPAELAVLARPHLAVTDEAGRFAIDGLPPGRARVEAVKHPLTFARTSSPVSRVGEPVHFVARNQVEVEVRVLLPDGQRPERARLEITGEGRVRRETWSAADPDVRLPEGPIRIEAGIPSDPSFDVWTKSGPSTARYAGMTSRSVEVNVRAGMAPIELRLDEQGGIRVEVETHPDFPTMGVAAAYCLPSEIVPLGTPSDVLARLLATDERVRSLAPLDLNSAIAFDKLGPGTYDVFLAMSLEPPLFMRQRLNVGTRLVVAAWPLSTIDLSLGIEVRLLFPASKLEENDFRLEETAARQRGEIVDLSDPLEHRKELTQLDLLANFVGDLVPVPVARFMRWDGVIALVPGIPDWCSVRPGVVPESLTVRATHEEYGEGEATIDLATKYIEIPIVRPIASRIDVVVRNAGNVSSSNCRLAVYAVRENDAGVPSIRSDSPVGRWVEADGTAVFESLGPGEYSLELWLTAENSDVAEIQLATRRIRFVDTAHVEFVIPELHALTVDVKGTSECEVNLSSFDDPSIEPRSMTTDARGSARFTLVPAGRWLVGASSGANVVQSLVRIPEQSSLSLELGTVNCYRVWITEPAGALATAGFQDGDLILAVDDIRFDGGTLSLLMNGLAASKRRSGAGANPRQHFVVLRGGSEIGIDFTPAANLEPTVLGGTVTPWHRP